MSTLTHSNLALFTFAFIISAALSRDTTDVVKLLIALVAHSATNKTKTLLSDLQRSQTFSADLIDIGGITAAMMRIMTMMWLLLSFHLITSVWPFPVVVSPTYQTVEDNNITIGWDFHTTTDLSLTKLVCVLLSKPPKVLYEMRNGVEVPESPHQQFTGRVQLDKDALRGGRFRLDLSTVTAEDSGNYRCEVVANYDKTRSTWEFDASETFVLNVNQVADEDNSDVSVNTETSGAETTQGLKTWDYIQLAGLIGALLATVVAAVGKLLYDNPPKKGPEAHVDLLAAEAKQKLRI